MICKICLNDNSVRNISFNSDGICCFCEKYEKIKDKLNDQSTLSSLFEQRVEKVRGNYDYDAAVGISGGKDSVYVLYRLAKDYGLHIRAFTMDNGFLSTKARENIDRVVSQLGVEHEYIEFDMKKLQRFYHYSMKKWLVPCIACSYIGYASMVNYASRINAGMVVHGRSPAQMIRFYDKDIYSELIKPGLLPPEDTDISGLYSSLLKNIEKKMDRDIMLDVREMLMKDTNEKDLREFVAFFLYHPYNENKIVDFLRKEVGWNPPEDYDHYDCTIHNAARYIYQKAEGRPHSLPEISSLIRMGELTRQEGSRMLESLIIKEKPVNELDSLLNFADINENMLFLKAKLYSLQLRLNN